MHKVHGLRWCDWFWTSGCRISHFVASNQPLSMWYSRITTCSDCSTRELIFQLLLLRKIEYSMKSLLRSGNWGIVRYVRFHFNIPSAYVQRECRWLKWRIPRQNCSNLLSKQKSVINWILSIYGIMRRRQSARQPVMPHNNATDDGYHTNCNHFAHILSNGLAIFIRSFSPGLWRACVRCACVDSSKSI